jgi:signal transduction histidine kinase
MSGAFWAAVELAVAGIETALMHMFARAFLKNRRELPQALPAAIFLAIWAVKFAASFFFSQSILIITLSSLLSLAFLASARYRCKPYWVPITVAVYFSVAALAEVLAVSVISAAQSVAFSDVMAFTPRRFQALALIELIVLFFIKLVERFRAGKISEMSAREWMPLCLLPIPTIVIIMQTILYSVSDSNPVTDLSVVTILASVCMNVIVFSLIESMIRRGEKDMRLELAETRLKIEKGHIAQMAEQHERMLRLSHDFKHHVQAMGALAEAQSFGELSEYLRRLAGEQVRAGPAVSTGNPVLDALLSTKKAAAERRGIRCEWNLSIPPELGLPDVDLCALLGNALDNAIEACERAGGQTFIQLGMFVSGGNLLCAIKNTVGAQPEPSEKLLKTAKSGPALHGIGMKSMKWHCDSMGGDMGFEYDENSFDLRLLLPLNGDRARSGRE